MLMRNAIQFGENRPQRLMPCCHVGQGLLQRVLIQISFQAQRQRDVISCAGAFHTVNKP